MCLARWRCFRILFLRTTFTSVFVTKLYFWYSILLEKCFGLLATKSDYLWAVYHKNQRFAFLCLKYAAFSFIREETCLGLFAVKLVFSQRYCTGKRFSASLQRVMLLFISFCSKERFRFSSAKLRCFQHYRTGFSLSSYVKCAFDPLSYRKHVLACWQWDRMFRAFCYKKPAISFFVSEYSFLSPIVAKIRFLHVGNKIALLSVLYHKKKAFLLFRC